MMICCPVCGKEYYPDDVFVSINDTEEIEVFKCEQCDCEFTIRTEFITEEVAEKNALW